ncbi:hypothetical protein [Pararhodonellum marinum]|uniref:hypothetical protein n=1 Tax=Pararhodonellum marinum TaxID=2755358 RepID=UPI00188FFD21|nr:hypothetical protein [Pararhodonellum marinum]
MIQIKPKKGTYISLGLVVLILIVGLSFLLNDFATKGSFGLAFYLISTSLITLVLLMLLVKMMAGYRFLSAGQGKIQVRLPLKGINKSYPVEGILAWQEELVEVNKRKFKQLTIVFEDKKSFSISNQEHSSYEELVKYLHQKAPKKKVK